MRSNRRLWVLVILSLMLIRPARPATYVVDVDAGLEEHRISKMARGAGLIYSWPDDAMFTDEEAHFSLMISNAAEEWANGAFDNIAVSGGTAGDAMDSVLIGWRAETGRKYTVMQADNLVSGEWNAATGTLIGMPGDMSVSTELEFPGFYQLEINP